MPCQNYELRLSPAPELEFQSCAPELLDGPLGCYSEIKVELGSNSANQSS
jgi:hypothetical protein